MFKATIPGILNKSRTLLARRFGSETQNLLAQMLFNDDVNVLTTFDMNRIASYTFGDTICGEIFDVLEYTLRHPLEFTVLSLHKTLVLMHHLAIYASQKAANNTWILKPHVQPLIQYNTVLWAIQEPKSMLARVQRIKGGSVDRGRPVRESATVLHDLLTDVQLFKQIRDSSADPDSLVPVGHHEQVGFVSDDIRKATLEEQLRNKHKVQIKSSLQDGGLGGFGSTIGAQTVVGAAHSMEEMLMMAKKNRIGYRDGFLSEEEKAHGEHLRQLEEELKLQKAMGFTEDGSGNGNGNRNAGSGSTRGPVAVDLLDFGNDELVGQNEIRPSTSVDSLPYAVAKEDPFTFHVDAEEEEDANADTQAEDNYSSENDVFGASALSAQSNYHSSSSIHVHDPFDSAATTISASVSNSNAVDLLSLSMGGMGMNNSNGNGNGHGNGNGNGQASSTLMGGMSNTQSSSAFPMSAFDDLPSSSSLLMGNSSHRNAHANSNNNLMGGTAAAMGMPPAPNMQPPAPPTEAPPLPPPTPTDVPPRPQQAQAQTAQLMGNQCLSQSMPHSHSTDMHGMNNAMGSTGSMNATNGMNGMNMNMNMNMNTDMNMGNMPAMNPMMMGNPMMMQNAMQNMNPEQQSQMMQQMMMMNQQMMTQLMQLQGQQGQGQVQGQGSNNNNGGSNHNHGGSNINTDPNTNYPSGLNPFSG